MPMTIKPNSPICRDVSERFPSETKLGIVYEKNDQRDEQDDGDDIVHPSPAEHLADDVIGHVSIAQPVAHSPIVMTLSRPDEKALSRLSGPAPFVAPVANPPYFLRALALQHSQDGGSPSR